MPAPHRRPDRVSFSTAVLFRFDQRHEKGALGIPVRIARESVILESSSVGISFRLPAGTLSLSGFLSHARTAFHGRLRLAEFPAHDDRLARGMEIRQSRVSILSAGCGACVAGAGACGARVRM